ncbi:pentatricopeptide repeat-containing protein At2g04860 [Neltuma alba]|uniref:pentatricopeptide repeat-containing protein At2g04860-like n=1 Tax=Neltuma alba TaxID=207710 RepID=UPI0010A4FFF5|nr:pentatricopeptide repeat-containing protein At2g04860-like [Prosopis alba]XP_028785986.1 pentatricopeptide repeat-containing protein At2g04860-like [Prosopis alba]
MNACTVWSSKTRGISFFHSLLTSYNGSQSEKWPLVIFRQLLEANANPNDLTFSLLIKAFASSFSSDTYTSAVTEFEVSQVQTQLVRRGINRLVYVNTALLDFYMKLGLVTHARQLFEDMPCRDVVSWNALICGYSRNEHGYRAVSFFVQMLREGFRPDHATIVGLAPACGRCELILQGRSLHGFGIKAGLGFDCQLKNALSSMYAKCENLEASELLFEEMSERSLVSWNSMIGAYGQNGFSEKAMICFKEMLSEGVQPGPVTMMNLLSANAAPESIHCYIIKCGMTNHASVITSLVCLYAGQGLTHMAELLYKHLPTNSLISLTAIMSSYAEIGDINSVVGYFIQTQQLDMKLDAVALLSVLHGIIDPPHFAVGRAFHAYGLKTGLTTDGLVTNGLISLYSKFDEIEAVYCLFLEMSYKSLITWNSVISGCVHAGKSSDAMDFFCQMKKSGQKPDAITISSLLCGCSQLGYLRTGETLHNHVIRNNAEMEDFTGTALIDMYTKCGRLDYAEKVFNSIVDPCLATWNSIISGYSLYGVEYKAFTAYDELQKQGLKPDKITFLGVLAACAHGGLVCEGTEYFRAMIEEHGLMPDLQHYACVVGLLSRPGLFHEAMEFINNMKIQPDSAVWISLLSACSIHQEIKLGECLANKLFFMDQRNGGFYVLMSNLYATVGRWDDVARVRDMMRDSGGGGCSGVSVIEVTSIEDLNNNLGMNEVYLNTNTLQPFCL